MPKTKCPKCGTFMHLAHPVYRHYQCRRCGVWAKETYPALPPPPRFTQWTRPTHKGEKLEWITAAAILLGGVALGYMVMLLR
jgi:hypothetical protein